MVTTTALSSTTDGVIWPKRPLVSASGLISIFKNLKYRSGTNEKPSPFTSVAFHYNQPIFAATDTKGHVFCFFVKANRYALVRHLGVATVACAFSRVQPTELLVSCADSTIRCVDIESQTLVATLRFHRHPATSLSFQLSGHLLLSASSDAVVLWDCRDWTRFRTLNAGPGVEQAKLAGNGESNKTAVAVIFRDNAIMMWDLKGFQVIGRFTLADGEDAPGLKCFSVSTDQQMLVASGSKPVLYVWQISSQTLVRVIELPPSLKKVVKVTFLRGNKGRAQSTHMVSVLGGDGRLHFINVGSKKPHISLQVSNDPKAFIASDMDSQSRYVVSSSSDGCLLLHDIDVARGFAARVKQSRKEQGIPEIDEEDVVHTRSAFVKGNSMAHPILEEKFPETEDCLTGPEDEDDVAKVKMLPRESSLVTKAFGSKDVMGKSASTKAKNVAARREERVRNAPSLYHLAKLTEEECKVNQKRLESMLSSYGEYPAKYRLLIWRFLLRLPENNEAFVSLLSKGTHGSYLRLHEKYPIQSQRLFRRLLRVVSAIAYWCPVFGEVPYIPALVFPFVKVCTTDDLAAFEICLSVLLNWGSEWLQTFPHPPLRVLTVLEDHLAHHDNELYDHLVEHQVNAQVYGWSLLRTLFTEVFSKDEWLRFWDHMMTRASDPTLLYVAVYAYIQYFRSAILSASDPHAIEALFHQQNAIDMSAYIKLIYRLQDVCAFEGLFETSDDVPQQVSSTGEITVAPGKTRKRPSYWPLPRGQYPAFHNYPKFVVDFQLQERERIALEEGELLQKRHVLDEIEERTETLRAEHAHWAKQQEKVLEAEEERRKQAQRQERQRLAELRNVEESTRQRRLEQISRMEQSAQESLQQASKVRELEYQRLQDQLALQKEREEYQLASRKEEEKLLSMEFEAAERVKRIQMERAAEERARNIRHEFAAKEKSATMQDKIRADTWSLEDEERRLKQRIELESQQKIAMLNKELEVQRLMEQEYMERLVDKEAQLLVLQKERRLRHIQEDESARVSTALEVRKHEEEILLKEQTLAAKREAEAMLEYEEEKSARRRAVLEEEKRRDALELEARKARVAEMERRQASSEFANKLNQKKKELEAASELEEKQFEDATARLDNENRKDKVIDDSMKALKKKKGGSSSSSPKKKVVTTTSMENVVKKAVKKKKASKKKEPVPKEDKKDLQKLEEELQLSLSSEAAHELSSSDDDDDDGFSDQGSLEQLPLSEDEDLINSSDDDSGLLRASALNISSESESTTDGNSTGMLDVLEEAKKVLNRQKKR